MFINIANNVRPVEIQNKIPVLTKEHYYIKVCFEKYYGYIEG